MALVPNFRLFKSNINEIEKPRKFTYPFFYEPHPLSLIASTELQTELLAHPLIAPLFDSSKTNSLPTGKMFGVLVVEDQNGNLGYLAGFSGKLGNHGTIEGFVPPVFDLWDQEGFFLAEETILNDLNAQINVLEKDEEYLKLQHQLKTDDIDFKNAIQDKKNQLKKLKNERKEQREKALNTISEADFELINEDLIKQSLRDKHELRVLISYWQNKITETKASIQSKKEKIEQLKELRKEKSNALQNKLFQNYQFLNISGEVKDLLTIFEATALQKPPAAAGDCAAPKLLQYAFKNQLKPIALAEFWWGKAPKSEIRKHLNFYPACRGKCEPILGHMLEGMSLDNNPLIETPTLNSSLEIIYEDEEIIVVNKPAEFLSVPGIHIQDSVYERMKTRYPEATGPLIIHRLDMATSGLLVLAKTKDAHKYIQSQFIKKTVEKRYVALLDGTFKEKEGFIELPLRVDLDDRPRQLVCYDYGKPAKTKWELIHTSEKKSKVYFYPITGRTHQLRVHASHPQGLNAPIIGDDLYGSKANRLHLHAESIRFKHPKTKEWIQFQITEDF